MQSHIRENREIALVSVFFLLIYLLFPTRNSVSDAMGYATAKEIGPHHLLYDQLVVWVNYACGYKGITTLAVMKMLNAVFTGFLLFFTGLIARFHRIDKPWLAVFFTGSSFALMRFSTENEVYILPLFLGIVAWWLFLQYCRKKNIGYLFLSAILVGSAVLAHQSYIFWALAMGIALFTGDIRLKYKILIPIIAIVPVLLIHFICSFQFHMPFTSWVLKDVQEGLVDLTPGLGNWLFTPVSFIRSFVQIHGNILHVLHAFPILYIPVFATLFCLIMAVVYTIKIKRNTAQNQENGIRYFYISAFTANLIFAWFSEGNAEFMVMLPWLLFFIANFYFKFYFRSLFFLSLGMLLWNLSLAVLPASFLDFESRKNSFEIVKSKAPCVFIAHNKTTWENYAELLMDTGKTISCTPPLQQLGIKILKSPADIEFPEEINFVIHQAGTRKVPVYTDCIEYPEPKSRHALINGDFNMKYLKKYQAIPVDSFSSFYGKVMIYQLLP